MDTDNVSNPCPSVFIRGWVARCPCPAQNRLHSSRTDAIETLSSHNKVMDSDLLQYLSGEEIHAGDRVQYRGVFGTVVFVSNGETEEFAPGYEEFTGSDRGVMICDDDGAMTAVRNEDENLSFVDRG
jgi:hypothetical protein